MPQVLFVEVDASGPPTSAPAVATSAESTRTGNTPVKDGLAPPPGPSARRAAGSGADPAPPQGRTRSGTWPPGATRRRAAVLCAAALAVALWPRPVQADAGCLKCHYDPALQKRLVDPARKVEVDVRALAKSVHADLACTDCHTQLADAEAGAKHAPKLGPPHCESCHDKAAETYAKSVHGKATAAGKRGQAHCADCHGGHDILRVKDPHSRVYKLRLPLTCAKCHTNAKPSKEHHIKYPQAAKHYVESIHGHALLHHGLIVAPSCTDCHGSHEIQRDDDPRSPIHHKQIPATCGRCHAGVIEAYESSVHGKLLAAGKGHGPVCNDCHTAHEIVPPDEASFKLASDERCGRCHADRLRRYRESYHGKAIRLGQPGVAACFDCHGHHNVYPASDPRSPLHAKNLLKTCQRCHEKATASFTTYQTHGDHSDRKNYPRLYWAYMLMTGLLLAVFSFFALHTVLWFTRSLVLLLRDPEAFRAAKRAARVGRSGRLYVRFRPVDRFCHFLVIVSFLLLVLTGMPLKFYDTAWARWVFDVLGGARVAGVLHRLGAALTMIYFAVHIASLVGSLWRNRARYRDASGRLRLRRLLGFVFGPDSPMPNLQDLRDFWAHQKWFFGRGPQPQFDRWTYWEKFDYLAVFWGVAVIGLSGLLMWFPEELTRWIPGWTINIALIMHSDEALLAAGFIFTFHFFNVHFRVEKFPMDPVIFSGRITEEELKHERGRLYDRLVAEGRLEQEEVRDEWPLWSRIFTPIGFLAFSIGVGLIIAIYWAMAKRLIAG